jgi:phage FluMu protein Com
MLQTRCIKCTRLLLIAYSDIKVTITCPRCKIKNEIVIDDYNERIEKNLSILM